ncbi:hypothetical protein [Olsenella sp. oral taxon 809]|uniref:hypothetical protein n=1 Tax=Olsenella sp. oral taxon 809 TaxID=661086 RepID=UPI00350F9FEF
MAAPPAAASRGSRRARSSRRESDWWWWTLRATPSSITWSASWWAAWSRWGAATGDPSWLSRALEARQRSAAGPTAPAQGLCLEAVRYDEGALVPWE